MRGMVIVIVFIAFWQALVNLISLPPYILPAPWQVGVRLLQDHTLLLSHFWPTLVETVLGLSLSIILGMSLALSMISIRWVGYWLLPVTVISQALPTFALAPLLVLWFGYGLFAKVLTLILMLFFPIASAFYDGLKQIPLAWLEMAHIMHGKPRLILWYVKVPAALPNLAAGIRVATALAPLGAIISEWVGASEGLGYLMLNANARLDTSLMFASIVLLMLFALLLYFCVNQILNKLLGSMKI